MMGTMGSMMGFVGSMTGTRNSKLLLLMCKFRVCIVAAFLMYVRPFVCLCTNAK